MGSIWGQSTSELIDGVENRWNEIGELLLLPRYGFTAFVQRISVCGEIQNIIFTPDKVLNVSMYLSFYFDEIQYVGEYMEWL